MIKHMITFCLVLSGLAVQAQVNNIHLNIGDDAPLIEGVDQFGKTVNSTEILKDKEILLIFYRGSWCPFCSKHLKTLQSNLKKLTKKGYYVVVVSPEKAEKTKGMSDKIKAGFSILHDDDSSIMDDYLVSFAVNEANIGKNYKGYLKRTAEYNSPGNQNLPVPATYIINKEGKISMVHYDPDYKQRFDVTRL